MRRSRFELPLKLLCALACSSALALGVVACSDDDEENGEESGEASQGGEGGESGENAPGGGEEPPAEGMETHLDLIELAHLADVDHGGLYIDFGTAARMKYTSGTWNSGWGADRIVDGQTVSRFGDKGRVYFPAWEDGALTIRIHMRGVGSNQLIAFVNGTNVGEPRVGDGFETVNIEVPANLVRRGENYLLLRSTESTQVEGEAVSFEVASLWVRSAGATDAQAPPPITSRESVGGNARDGLAVDAPTTLSWFIEVPENGKLLLSHGHVSDGDASIRVRATPEGGDTQNLGDIAVGENWGSTTIDLGPLAGKIVRLSLEASGNGRIALSRVIVAIPDPEMIAAREMRNVIVLTIDTLRASKLQPYNPRTRVQTPAFSAFANENANFQVAQTSENWTKPAVASILTSLFPVTHTAKNDGSILPSTVTTLGEVFQAADFETGSFLANGHVSRAFGFDQGWDHYTNYIRENRNTEAENVFGEAATWIEANKDGRFFAYIQTIDPHVPYDPPDDFLHMYDARTDYSGRVRNRSTADQLSEAKRQRNSDTPYFDESDVRRLTALHDGEITQHDRHFATFLAKLDELGLSENTIVVVTSDHGEEFNEHGSWGHGHSVFQELLHVPLAMRWPGVTDAGRSIPQVVSTMDIGPTILDAAGVAIPEVFEGRSLTDYLRGGVRPGPAVAFSDFQENRRVITGGGWKLILRSSLTYVLFDLNNDPRERNELDGRRNPIAMRYLRILSGQQLGATNRTRWLEGTADAVGTMHNAGEAMTEELCRQLVALGYMDCLSQFPGAE
ncbi:MAG: choline-sulfatase [Polyangiales bacterium]|jgi:choline-sulfatase